MDHAYTDSNVPTNVTLEAGFGGSQPGSKIALDAYRREEFLHLTPEQAIHKLMTLGIQGCRKGDKTQAVRAVNVLILALDFKYSEVAMGLFRLYDYSKNCIYKGEFDEAINILDGLRVTWAEAFHLKEAA